MDKNLDMFQNCFKKNVVIENFTSIFKFRTIKGFHFIWEIEILWSLASEASRSQQPPEYIYICIVYTQIHRNVCHEASNTADRMKRCINWDLACSMRFFNRPVFQMTEQIAQHIQVCIRRYIDIQATGKKKFAFFGIISAYLRVFVQ